MHIADDQKPYIEYLAGRRVRKVSERMAPLNDDQREQPEFAPDVAIEVRLPSDRASDVQWKIRAYLDHGAKLVMDVDPQARVIHVHTPVGVRALLAGERVTSDALPWLTFDVAEAFADLDRA